MHELINDVRTWTYSITCRLPVKYWVRVLQDLPWLPWVELSTTLVCHELSLSTSTQTKWMSQKSITLLLLSNTPARHDVNVTEKLAVRRIRSKVREADCAQVALSLKLSHIDISQNYDLLTHRVSQVLPFPPASWLQVSCLQTDSVKCVFNQVLPQSHASTSFILPMKINP